MSEKGVLAVVSGFSGAGKGTLMNVLTTMDDSYALSISATTREPRPGEINAVHYFFVSREKFQNMIAADELIEYAEYTGNYYGTPRKFVEEQLAAGKNVILEIEVQGAMKIKEKFPEAVTIFVTPPTADELKKRLIGRGTETEEKINARMKRAEEEAEYMKSYDFLLINDDLEKSAHELHELIRQARKKMDLHQEFIVTIKQELNEINHIS